MKSFLSFGMAILVFAAVVLCLASCATKGKLLPKGTRDQIFYADTPEYQGKIATFRVSLQQAKSLLTEHVKMHAAGLEPANTLIGRHLLVIGDCYHFFFKPKDIPGIPLTGYYVNGDTGTVEFKEVEGSVRHRSRK